MPIMVVLVMVISSEWPLPRKSRTLDTFGLLSLASALRQLNNIPIVNYMPLRIELHLLPSILSSQLVLSINGLLTLWIVDPHILIKICILSWALAILSNGLKPYPHSITP